jgi:hypothetical protein
MQVGDDAGPLVTVEDDPKDIRASLVIWSDI